MKIKTLILSAVLAGSFVFANAQDVAVGDKVLNLGIGLGSTLYSGTYYKSAVPPISASLEFVLKDDLFDGKGALGVGGYLGYSSYKYEYLGWGWKYSNIILGPRGFLHYKLVDKLDTYTGLLIGYDIVSSKEFGNTVPGYDYSANSGGLIWSWFAGGRYYFSDKFAGMLELGFGISYLTLGVAINL